MMGAWPKWLHGLGRAQLGARTGCADCPRPTTLYYGAIALCRACAQMRALSLLTYGGVTTTMSTHRDEFGEFHIHDSGTIDIDGLTPVDDAGDAIAAYAKQLLRSGQAETLSEATHMALKAFPDDARPYLEGPRSTYQPPEGEQLLRDLQARYIKGGGDRGAVEAATTLRELINALNDVVSAEARRTGADPVEAWRTLLGNDRELARAAQLS